MRLHRKQIISVSILLVMVLGLIIRTQEEKAKCSIKALDVAMGLEQYEIIQSCTKIGAPRAMSLLAQLHMQGKGVEQDHKKAMELALRASEQDDMLGMSIIARLYNNGLGVTQSYDTAIEWYKKAIELGSVDDMYNISIAYANRSNLDGNNDTYSKLAHEWLVNAANAGQGEAMNRIASYYQYGWNGFAQDYSQSMVWYKKSADAGYIPALVGIGDLYASGLGVEQDYEIATEWYLKAAEKGNKVAQDLAQPNPSPLGLELTKATTSEFKKLFPIHTKSQYINKYNGGTMYLVESKYVEIDGIVGNVIFVFNKQDLLEAVLMFFAKRKFSSLKDSLDVKYKKYINQYAAGNSAIILENNFKPFSYRNIDKKFYFSSSITDFVTLIYETIPFLRLVVEEDYRLDEEEKKARRNKEKLVRDKL
jgi:TPR repeat protein